MAWRININLAIAAFEIIQGLAQNLQQTFRRKGHAEHDPADYVPKKLRAEWEAKDPLDAYTRFILGEQIAGQAEIEEIDSKIDAELEKSVEEVLDSPFPPKEVAMEDVYASDRNDGESR